MRYLNKILQCVNLRLNIIVFTLICILLSNMIFINTSFAETIVENVLQETNETDLNSKIKMQVEPQLLQAITEGTSVSQNTELDINIQKDYDIPNTRLKSVVTNGQIYVTVGERGVIKVSKDTVTWTGVDTKTSNDLNDVIWNGSIFVAVGYGGTILYSENGYDWTEATDKEGTNIVTIDGQVTHVIYGLSQNLYSLVYNNGLFVAVGYYGEIWLSKDANKWVPAYSKTLIELKNKNIIGQNCNLLEVTSDGKSFIITGSNAAGDNIILKSTDGEEWYLKYSNKQYDYQDTLNMMWTGSQFVILNKGNSIVTSNDGETWTKKSLVLPENYKATDIAYNNGEYAIIGQMNYSNIEYYTSKDLNTWTKINLNNTDSLYSYYQQQYDFIKGKDGYISVGESGLSYKLYNNVISKTYTGKISGNINAMANKADKYVIATDDGIFQGQYKSWDKVDVYGSYKDVKVINNNFYVVGNNKILKSVDGINYEEIYVNGYLLSLAYGNGTLIAVGRYGSIVKSTDGLTWENIPKNTTRTLNKVIYTGEFFIAVGDAATVLKSYDGVNWTTYSLTNKIYGENEYVDNIKDIIWDGNTFVSIGEHIATSKDGESWHILNLLTDGVNLDSINKINNRFIATGYMGQIVTSTDGLNWIAYNKYRDEMINLLNLYYDGNNVYGLGENGLLSTIDITDKEINVDDGWKYEEGITRFALKSLATNGKRVITVGDYGQIKYSDDASKWIDVKSEVKSNLNKIKYLNNKFYILGNDGILMSSLDGVTWTQLTSNTTFALNDIEYNGKTYVVIGDNGLTLYSKNGIDWTVNTNISGRNIKGINIINYKGNFMMFAKEWSLRIFTSTDGVYWNETKVPFNTFYIPFNVVSDGNTIVVSDQGANVVSSDGINWVKKDNLDYGKVFYLDNRYIKYGLYNSYYSTDTNAWTNVSGSVFGGPQDVIKFKEKYIAVNGGIGGNSNIAISNDALNWQEVKIPIGAQSMSDVKWLGGRYIVTGNDNNILTSMDGYGWKKGIASGGSGIFETAWNGNVYVAGSVWGSVFISRYGDNWERIQLDCLNNGFITWVETVKWIGDRFIAICNTGEVISSLNGYNWTKVGSFTDSRVWNTKIVYLNGKYLLFAGSNTALEGTTETLISSDGVNWTKKYTPILFKDNILINNKLMSLGTDGYIYNSIDGYNWTKTTTSRVIDKDIMSSNIIYDGTNLNIITEKEIFTSKDGVTWASKALLNNLYFIKKGASNGNTMISVGDMATIMKKKISDSVKPERIELIGNSFISKTTSSKTYNYNSRVFDTIGNDVSNSNSGNIKWSIKTSIPGVIVNATSGQLTVPANSSSGTIKLTAKLSEEVFATKIINVGDSPLFTLDKSTVKIRSGETFKVNTVIPSNTFVNGLTYNSSNISVITVDGDGNVLGGDGGDAILSVSQNSSGFEQEVMVKVIPLEDIDMNGAVEIKDLAMVSLKYNTTSNNTGYDKLYDFNNDGFIDIFDLARVAKKIR